MDKKKLGNITQNVAGTILFATALSKIYPDAIDSAKDNLANRTIAAKKSEVANLQRALNAGDKTGSEFVDTKNYINEKGELVIGQYKTFDNANKIKQLKAEIKDTKAEDMQLSFADNAFQTFGAFSSSFAIAYFAHAGIGLIRKKFGDNINNFCDGVGNKVKSVFKKKAPNEL